MPPTEPPKDVFGDPGPGAEKRVHGDPGPGGGPEVTAKDNDKDEAKVEARIEGAVAQGDSVGLGKDHGHGGP